VADELVAHHQWGNAESGSLDAMEFTATNPRPVNVNNDFTITGDDIGNLLNLNDSGGGKYQCLHAVLPFDLSEIIYWTI
jgi:hypothetical protein